MRKEAGMNERCGCRCGLNCLCKGGCGAGGDLQLAGLTVARLLAGLPLKEFHIFKYLG